MSEMIIKVTSKSKLTKMAKAMAQIRTALALNKKGIVAF